MPQLYCCRKKHKHFDLSHVREGQRSVVNSVKVAVVASLSLHHQQCDKFLKIQQESKWTAAVIWGGFKCPFLIRNTSMTLTELKYSCF